MHEKGYQRAGLGWSRPFLRDGVLQFKKKWSQKITAGYTNSFALRILSDTPATRACLGNNPFIFCRGGRFYGAVFVNAGQPLPAEEIQRIAHDYSHPGLSRLLIYRLGGEPAAMPHAAAAPLSPPVEVRTAGGLPRKEFQIV